MLAESVLFKKRCVQKNALFRDGRHEVAVYESCGMGQLALTERRLGLGQLRVRGHKAVFHALYLKVAGWNLFRAVASGRLVAKVAAAVGGLWSTLGVVLLLTLAWGRIRVRNILKLRVDGYCS
jgi:hypothetical protein